MSDTIDRMIRQSLCIGVVEREWSRQGCDDSRCSDEKDCWKHAGLFILLLSVAL